MASKSKKEKIEETLSEDIKSESKENAAQSVEEKDVPELDYKDMFEKCNASLDEANKKYLYLYAEFDNYKKRNRNISEEKFADGRNMVLTDLFNIIDNMDRAIKCIEKDSDREGVEMIKKQMFDVLTRYGVEEIDALDKEFDPTYHNAIMRVEDSEKSGKVVNQAQKGYKIGDKVLRYAQVVVAE